ncbi:DUF2589 domain-containing protein [Polyangium sp. 15x6]|uniref:DUF2589 domain-containing protein n=1 Tax=Polyangium sp. 15x6 TaxID=3042687 RepID=UPI00249CCDCA|nr:DUF2589 domain-containing protein [Polyangium sp. 15x6]MDI3283302.1 DUF2589 domain-containing protein [Polyangium sp. 15x6]
MADSTVSQIPLSQLVGSLVRDIVDADGMAAKATSDFIQNVGFDKGELRMVQFSYQQVVPGAGVKRYTVSVPLLTLVPIPILGIEKAEISFTTTIVEMSQDDSQVPRLHAKLAADLASTKSDGGMSETTDVKFTLTMARSDVPAGLTGIFGLLGNNIQVTGAPAKQE